MKIKEIIKENPKSMVFTVALILTVLSVLFEENEIISVAILLFTSVFGLDVKNYMRGAIEDYSTNDEEEGA